MLLVVDPTMMLTKVMDVIKPQPINLQNDILVYFWEKLVTKKKPSKDSNPKRSDIVYIANFKIRRNM